MDFKTIFSILKNRLSDGDDVPSFFRELLAMITSVSEADWGTKKDPSSRVKDDTLRSYSKRGLTKAFAKSIVYRLTPERLASMIQKRPSALREALAEDLQPYNDSANKDNVGKIVADLLVEIIRTAAGIVPADELIVIKQQETAVELKHKYGELLRNEAGDCCPFPGCGRALFITNGDKAIPSYEVCIIDKGKGDSITNLIALCPNCYAVYSVDTDKAKTRELNAVKKILLGHKESARLLDDLPLEKGIIAVISRIRKLDEKDLENASLEPKEIKQKMIRSECFALYKTVNEYVTTYYVRLREIMVNLDKCGEIDYDEIQDQMKALYRRLKKTKKSREEIFNEIVEKIHRVTLQEALYCQIVVSYFIQSCEVFDAIA
ncbi:MAG: HNH endonuclease signature motif containing protein [Clostridia bacterium]|nr:HNH endonuclease signature motif containing protein [Clostridia bacterium]